MHDVGPPTLVQCTPREPYSAVSAVVVVVVVFGVNNIVLDGVELYYLTPVIFWPGNCTVSDCSKLFPYVVWHTLFTTACITLILHNVVM